MWRPCSARRCARPIVPAYRVFGYAIESPIELPELQPWAGREHVDWHIRSSNQSFIGELGTALGTETVFDTVQVRAFGAGDVRTLVFDDTGTFQVRPRERSITWFPGPSATDVAVRADLLGRVLALAAHTDGHLALHASAVSIGDTAIGFLGPKHAGKSTLAMALVRAGARLITDDTLVVRLTKSGAVAAPGVQHVRLWDDAARALGLEPVGTTGAKPALDCLTPDELTMADVPLAACYVLSTVGGAAASGVGRRRLSAPQAAVACVRFSKLGALTAGADAPAVLERAAVLTRLVPVIDATVTRDLGALDRLAASFVAWHTEPDHAVP